MIIIAAVDPTIETQAPTIDGLISLTDVEFRIVQRWDDRLEAWFIDLYDADDVQLARGKRLVANYYLFDDQLDRRFPAGRLMLLDDAGTGVACGFEDLGDRCQLVYFEPNEVVEPLVNEVLYLIEAV